MDADETVLDNSEFERRIAETGQEFEEWMWDEWVLEEDADLIPGAGRFIEWVEALGGRMAIVTNRHQGLRTGPAEPFGSFGERYFILPNPMYGSWMGYDWW